MNKKIITLLLILLSLFVIPFKEVNAAWTYKVRQVQLGTFTSATGKKYNISNSVSYDFSGTHKFAIHQVNDENNNYYHGYCLNASKNVNSGATVKLHEGFKDLITLGKPLSEPQQELLKNILASSYQNGNNKIEGTIVEPSSSFETTCKDKNICKNVLVSQILVWEVMEYARTNYNYNPSNNVVNNTYSYVSSDPELLSIYKSILDQAYALSGEGNVPEAFGKTFTLTWNDTNNRYESEKINIGEYNVSDKKDLDDIGISVSSKDENNNITIYSQKELDNQKINFQLVKGSTADSNSFKWFKFEKGDYQDILMGNYRKVYDNSLTVKTEIGKFKFVKKDKDTNEEIKGAKFLLFKCKSQTDCGNTTKESNAVYKIDLTNNSSSNELILKKSGRYLVKEVVAPNGYEKIGDFYLNFVIKNGKTSVEINYNNSVTIESDESILKINIKNESKKYEVKKIDGATGKEIKGAGFRIRNSKGNYLKFTKIAEGSYIDDPNGVVNTLHNKDMSIYKFALLPKGEYVIEETSVPYPYILSGTPEERETKIKIDDNFNLNVWNYETNKYEKSNTASVTIENYKTSIELIKKGKNNIKLPGVVFELYNADKTTKINLIQISNGVYQYPEKGVGTPIQLVTNSEGKIIINYLPIGTYYIKEVKTIDGYVIDPTVEWRKINVSVTRNGQSESDKMFEWPNAKGEFCFYKIDEDGNYLNDGKFKIQVYNEKNSKYEDTPLIFNEKDKNYTFDKTGKSDIYLFTPIEKGQTCFVDINAKGKYRIVEIEAPKGFVLPKVSETNADFVVNENGYVLGNTTIINKKITVGEGSEAQAELIINISTGQQRIKYAIIITILITLIGGLIFLNKKIGKK